MQRLVDADPVGASKSAVVSGLPLDEEIERDVHPVHESSRDADPFAASLRLSVGGRSSTQSLSTRSDRARHKILSRYDSAKTRQDAATADGTAKRRPAWVGTLLGQL
jgi:hypothetical protein